MPNGILQPVLNADYKSDPLFQEIQRLMTKADGKVSGMNPLGNVDSNQPSPQVDSISDARWHAVETLLSAARTVSKDHSVCLQQEDQIGAVKTQSVIRVLRSQALDLLLAR